MYHGPNKEITFSEKVYAKPIDLYINKYKGVIISVCNNILKRFVYSGETLIEIGYSLLVEKNVLALIDDYSSLIYRG